MTQTRRAFLLSIPAAFAAMRMKAMAHGENRAACSVPSGTYVSPSSMAQIVSLADIPIELYGAGEPILPDDSDVQRLTHSIGELMQVLDRTPTRLSPSPWRGKRPRRCISPTLSAC